MEKEEMLLKILEKESERTDRLIDTLSQLAKKMSDFVINENSQTYDEEPPGDLSLIEGDQR